MGEVIEFRGIGYHVEQITSFVGALNGSLSLTKQEDPGGKGSVWMAIVSIPDAGEQQRKTFSSESFNKLILSVRTFVRNEL